MTYVSDPTSSPGRRKKSPGDEVVSDHVFQAQAVCALAVYQQVTDDTTLCFSRTTSAEISWIFYVYGGKF